MTKTHRARTGTAQRLERVARRIVSRQGAQALSVRGVAAAVGITPMAVYRHFPDRASLLARIVERGFAALAERAAAAMAHGDSPIDRVRALLLGYLDFALAEPLTFDAMFTTPRPDARRFPADLAAGVSPTAGLFLTAVREVLEADATDEDAFEAAAGLWAHGHGLIALYRAGRFSLDETGFRSFYGRSVTRVLLGFAR